MHNRRNGFTCGEQQASRCADFYVFYMGPGHDIQSPMVTGLHVDTEENEEAQGRSSIPPDHSSHWRPCHTWHLTELPYPEEVSVTLQTQRDGPTKIKKTAQVSTQSVCALSRAQAPLEVSRCDKGQCRRNLLRGKAKAWKETRGTWCRCLRQRRKLCYLVHLWTTE